MRGFFETKKNQDETILKVKVPTLKELINIHFLKFESFEEFFIYLQVAQFQL